MKSRITLWTVVALMAVSVFAGMEIKHLISGDLVIDQSKKFNEVLSKVENNYIKEVDVKKLTEAAVEGLLDKLDPHSVYIPAKAFEQVAEEFRGKFEGIGIRFTIRNDSIFVVEIIGGGPSARVGLQSNDRIVRINDSSAVGYSDDQVRQRLRGPKGTRVKVGIYRPGIKELLDFEITRDEIALNSVEIATMVSDNVGYVNVSKFSETTDDEMKRALKQLKDQGMKRLILDLRGNPGGYLDAAVSMASWFLPSGAVVVTEDYAGHSSNIVHRSLGYDIFNKNLKMVILVDKESASASEILADALRYYGVAKLVGVNTFGKGSVQELIEITPETSLKLTVARWLGPDGKQIPREGIVPDVKVEMSEKDVKEKLDPQLDKAVELVNK